MEMPGSCGGVRRRRWGCSYGVVEWVVVECVCVCCGVGDVCVVWRGLCVLWSVCVLCSGGCVCCVA